MEQAKIEKQKKLEEEARKAEEEAQKKKEAMAKMAEMNKSHRVSLFLSFNLQSIRF